MVTKIIHVYQQRIRQNIKLSTEDRLPPIIIREGNKRDYGTEILIDGPCKIVYSPDKPLDCGARLWIETESDVIKEK